MAICNAHTHLARTSSAPPRWPAGATLLFLSVALLPVACGGRSPEIPVPGLGADRVLFNRGNQALEEGDWTRAREYFRQLRDNYPQSVLRSQARLAYSDTLQAEGTLQSYIEALTEYREFLALYPTDPRADYAQYKLGMVYFRQMRRPERDQTETQNAISEFEVFVERFPNSEFLGEVRSQLREARDRLSESNFVVGQFYHRHKWYPGAIDRFEAILAEDPGYTGRDTVYFHLADSFQHSDRIEEALPLFERLVDEFPETEFLTETAERIAELKTRIVTEDP